MSNEPQHWSTFKLWEPTYSIHQALISQLPLLFSMASSATLPSLNSKVTYFKTGTSPHSLLLSHIQGIEHCLQIIRKTGHPGSCPLCCWRSLRSSLAVSQTYWFSQHPFQTLLLPGLPVFSPASPSKCACSASGTETRWGHARRSSLIAKGGKGVTQEIKQATQLMCSHRGTWKVFRHWGVGKDPEKVYL